MNEDKTFWWMLQLQLPEKNQPQLFTTSIPRKNLIQKSLHLIQTDIRLKKRDFSWGIADLNKVANDLFWFKLIVHPESAPIALERTPGHLEEAKDHRFFTYSVMDIPSQIIAIHKSSYISRYARSAKTFADVFLELFEKAVDHFEMTPHYGVEVEPIAQVGSFIEWMKGIDYLQKISIRYTGPNLPGSARPLVDRIRGAGKDLKQLFKAKDVELAANDPKLTNEEVEEIDAAVADRVIKLRAKGLRKQVVITWSSKTKPVPETLQIPVSEDQLVNSKLVANNIRDYVDGRFDRGQIEG